MGERDKFNCIGFVYHQQGIIDKEKPVTCPLYRDLLKHFVRVPEIVFADIIAIVVPSGYGPGVAHLAVVNKDKQTITHRKGANKPVSEGFIESELEPYTQWDEAEVVFLARKNGHSHGD